MQIKNRRPRGADFHLKSAPFDAPDLFFSRWPKEGACT